MKKKLFSLIKDFETWTFFSPLDNELKLQTYDNVPFIEYPNGIPCFEANLFIQTKLRIGLSRRVRGGTLKTYSYNISHLIRFCFNNNIKFTAMTDDWFTLFIQTLQAERKIDGKLARKDNQTLAIGRKCIDFLLYINDLYECKCFIGEGIENAVRVKKTERKKGTKTGKIIGQKITTSYTHASFPLADAEHIRIPMSDNAGAAIKNVISNNSNRDIRRRDTCIYQTLEQTGARRTEITLLTVVDIVNAMTSAYESPLLVIQTLKTKNDNSKRTIPVTRVFLNNIYNYIVTTRKKAIKLAILKKRLVKDHGFLFVTVLGTPLAPDTITTIISNYRIAAGITEDAFAHLLRHAYVTEKLKCLILEHDFNNADQFRKALLSTETLKIKLIEWTGHKNIESLQPYIDLAFADIANFKKTLNIISIKDSVGFVRDKLIGLSRDLKNREITPYDAIESLLGTIDAFTLDLETSNT